LPWGDERVCRKELKTCSSSSLGGAWETSSRPGAIEDGRACSADEDEDEDEEDEEDEVEEEARAALSKVTALGVAGAGE